MENKLSGLQQKEDGIRVTHELLYDVQKLARIGIWEWDKATDYVTWSEELFQIAGLDASLPAPDFSEQFRIYTPHSWNILQAAVKNALNTGESYQLELEMVRPDGTIRIVSANGGARFNEAQQIVTGLFGLVQDVTERRQTERALQESEVNFEKVINTMTETFSIINGDGDFLSQMPMQPIICRAEK